MNKKTLTTLGKEADAEFTEKKSVFIGHAFPVSSIEEAEKKINEIQKKFSDARHNVFAYIYENTAKASDDGEPQGTGGVPVLDVLKKNGVDKACVVVTRYFGGILLGAGGLVRSYSKAASMAVAAAGTVIYELFFKCSLTCEYGERDKLCFEARKYTKKAFDVQYGEKVTVSFLIPENVYSDFRNKISELTSGRTEILKTGEKFDIDE